MFFGLFSYHYSTVVVLLLVPDLLIFHERAFRICSNLLYEFAIILHKAHQNRRTFTMYFGIFSKYHSSIVTCSRHKNISQMRIQNGLKFGM